MEDDDILDDVMSDFEGTDTDSSTEEGETIAGQIERLASLQERGVLSAEELEQAKGILLGSQNTSGDPDRGSSIVTQNLREQDFSSIEKEIVSIYDVVRDGLEDLRNRATRNPDLVFDLDVFEKNPMIEIIEEGHRQAEGVLLLSKIERQFIELATEAQKNGSERVSELFETYEAGELQSDPGQTPEEMLFTMVLMTVGSIETSILDITVNALET